MLRTPVASVSRSTPAPAGWSGPGSDAGVNRGTQACRGAPDSGKIMEDLASVEDPVPQGDCRATLGSGMAHRCHGHGAPRQALRSTRKLLIPGPAAGLERQETPRTSKYAAPGQLSARCG